MGQQEEKVHSEAKEGLGAAFADGPGIPVKPYLREERRHVVHLGSEDAVVAVEEVALAWRVGGKAGEEPRVEALFGLAGVGEVLSVLPPGLQIAPADAVVGDGAVVDQSVAVDDLDVVVDCGQEPDVRLRGGGEDDVLRRCGRERAGPRPG
ncbi:hypothetical protein [Streptomyces gardneri]|uniref:hypothetical protein n=1 Tax=Streptomyces gardneri TaxID=66892 RepID=UPI0037D584C1